MKTSACQHLAISAIIVVMLSTLIADSSEANQQNEKQFFVDTSKIVNTVDNKIYGHFLEHIYHSVNGGLWGELIWNRSFENATGNGSGIWALKGKDIVQSSLSTDVHLEFGDPSWGDYELTLQAKKDAGNEAFLILVRAADSDNFYWCNLGGWGNTQHAIEKEVNGTRNLVGTTTKGRIDAGIWHDIRVRCKANRIQVWLNKNSNSKPILDYTDSDSTHLKGMIGLGTWSTKARYRDIKVTDLKGKVLYNDMPTVPESKFLSDFWATFGSGQAKLDDDALNDDYSVKIVSAKGATGLQQDDFKFVKQKYKASLWMKGTLPKGILIEMLDGSTVLGKAKLPAPTSEWKEYAFKITATSATNDGSLRITLPGTGTVYIDQVSLMGQDSIDVGGFRPDLLKAVKELRPPIIRWPGGCYASAYLWKEGIGPQYKHRKYPLNLWDDQDNNSYGTDEFLRMCEYVGAEPLIVVNIGLLNGTCGVAIPHKLPEHQYLQDVEDWIEYCNGSVDTQWGAVRAANGHPEPYNVKYWEIDNEVWSTGFGGGITNYIQKVKEYAPVMTAKAGALGTPIKLIACGSGSYDQNWNRTLIEQCGEMFDYISTHHYEGPDNFKQGPRQYEAFIEELGKIIAASVNPDMKIYMSEWNAQSTDWRTGLYAGGLLNAFERTGDVFEIGGPALFLRHTSATGWDNAFINFDHTGWFPAPNYMVMKLWYDHFATNRVETIGKDKNLNVVTLMPDDRKTLYIRVVNPDPDKKSVEFEIHKSFKPAAANISYISPEGLYARNTLSNPSHIKIQAKALKIEGQKVSLTIPSYSAGVITVNTEKPDTAKYLYSSFRNNGQDGLHLAYSEDGLSWTALKDDISFLAPQVGSKLMRDPSICQGPDGIFHMVWTTGWWDKGIGIAHSKDLINWSKQTFLPVMSHEPDAKNCWAPEIFYDETTNKFLIYWSTTIPGRFPETENKSDDNNHRIYYVSTGDFKTYSDTALLYDPGFNVIDAFIAKDRDRYIMFVKHESKHPTVQKNIRIAYSSNACGPYSKASESISPAWVEGPSAVRTGNEMFLYYDGYTRGRMEGLVSSDLKKWKEITLDLNFPKGTRHGTVFEVGGNILDELLNIK